MEQEGDNYTNHDLCFWYSHQRIIKGTGGLGGWRMSGDLPSNIHYWERSKYWEEFWRLEENWCHSYSSGKKISKNWCEKLSEEGEDHKKSIRLEMIGWRMWSTGACARNFNLTIRKSKIDLGEWDPVNSLGFYIKTDHLVSVGWPDLVIVSKKKRTCLNVILLARKTTE